MAEPINIEKSLTLSPEITPVKIEKTSSPENKTERILPKIERVKEAPKPFEKKGEGNIIATSQMQSDHKQQAAEIDTILSDGLNDVFIKMKPEEQKVFKKTGEETVLKISQLLLEAKVKVNKIVELIRKWLKLIPGVNKFFLEQEVKIKADKILKIKNKF